MPDPKIQTRVDDEIADAVEKYSEREQTNKSTAVRQFVLAGMVEMDELPEGVEQPRAADETTSPQTTVEFFASAEVMRWAGRLLYVAVAVLAIGAVSVTPLSPLGVTQGAPLIAVATVVISSSLLISVAVITTLSAAAAATLAYPVFSISGRPEFRETVER